MGTAFRHRVILERYLFDVLCCRCIAQFGLMMVFCRQELPGSTMASSALQCAVLYCKLVHSIALC